MTVPSQAAREAAIAFVRGNGPWKNSKINLPDDDYAVQAFARFEAQIRANASKWSVAVATAWLREQDGYGEWSDAADALDSEFLCSADKLATYHGVPLDDLARGESYHPGDDA